MTDQTWYDMPYPYYKLPKCLIGPSGLPPDCLLVYTVLLDRLRLSASNGDKWQDPDGRLFVFMPLAQVQVICHCGKDKASKIMSMLRDAGLIQITVQGLTRPNRIVVLPFRDVDIQATENPTSCGRNSGSLDTGRYDPINNKKNNTDINQTDTSICCSREVLKNMVHDSIFYDVLVDEMSPDCLDGIVSVIVDTLSTSKPTIRVLGNDMPRAQVVERLNALNDMHVRYVYDRLRHEDHKIHSPRQYILSRLYEAQDLMGVYYQTLVQYDLGKEV